VWFMQGYQTKPIYVFGSIGMLLGFSSVVMSMFVLYQKLIHHIFVHLQPLFVVSMMFAVMSVQFLGMGLIAEIMIRTYFESQQKAAYLIGWTAGFDRPPGVSVFVNPAGRSLLPVGGEHRTSA